MKFLAQNKFMLLYFTALIICVAFSSASAQTAKQVDIKELRQKLQANLDEWHKNGKFPGATLGVCLADGKCFSMATGFSDLESKTPMKPTDIMAAGSAAKLTRRRLLCSLLKKAKSIWMTGLKNISEKKLGFRAFRMQGILPFGN